MLRSLRSVPTTQAGGLGRPVAPGGSRWCVATRQVRRRRSWKRGRLGSSPVPEVPSQVTRWALCGLLQVMEVPWKFHGSSMEVPAVWVMDQPQTAGGMVS